MTPAARKAATPFPPGKRVAPDRDTSRLALSRSEAAAALGVSLRHFQRHVQPHVRCIYSGQLRLYPVAELERWIHDQSFHHGTAA
jgi:hypothetical protein